MQPIEQHMHAPHVGFDGGDLDCGNGLLLLIRKHIDPLKRGQLLEIRSSEISVEEDLPAWCRLTHNDLVSWTRSGKQRSFLVCKGSLAERKSLLETQLPQAHSGFHVRPVRALDPLPEPTPAPEIKPLSVMGIGSWPRPRWLIRSLHDFMEGRSSEDQFHETADDAVRLAINAQLRAEADVITDGEQRRDSYASFVGARLDNCLLIPLTDLLPLVDDPQKFQQELRALDVPAADVRHPAVFGPLGRSKTLAVHELEFAKKLTQKPIKIALPGPYLLTRTMWMECITDRAYARREDLARDIVRVLREELFSLLAAGAAMIQFDEPVLTEVVFTAPKSRRSFMCGALSEKGDSATELSFARELINQVTAGAPRSRVALHICRGNWTRDEGAALAGSYRPLLDFLSNIDVGTYFLELCTQRAGELDVLKDLPSDRRIGVGVLNQKLGTVDNRGQIAKRIERAIQVFGADRVLFNPDCGFATFADNPIASATLAEAALASIKEAVRFSGLV